MNGIALSLFPLTRVASDSGRRVEVVFWVFTAICGLIALTVAGMVAMYCVRYRAGSPRPRKGGSERIERWEIVWISALTVLALGMFGWASKSYYDVVTPPADARTIYIVGRQWMWKAEHPGGQHEINALHVPTGRPVQLTMISQDVFHSYSIPDFRVKREVIPGRYTTVWFNATDPGTYHLFCTQYCGTLHSGMIGDVIAMTPEDYERWAQQSTSGMSLAQNGERLFASMGCNACHNGTAAARGPNLAGVFGSKLQLTNGSEVLVNEAYLRDAILNPSQHITAGYAPIMPTYQGQISEDGLIDLVEYIKTLQTNYRVQQTQVTSQSNQAAPTTPGMVKP
jgi:cytochrome c oxidase subunit 2